MKKEIDSLKTTIEILNSPEIMEGIRKSEKEFKEGKDQLWENIRDKI